MAFLHATDVPVGLNMLVICAVYKIRTYFKSCDLSFDSFHWV